VEFAFALAGLFLFFFLYLVCTQLIVENSLVTFGGFTAARTFDVTGKLPAIKAMERMDGDAVVSFPAGGATVEVSKPILIPEGLRPVISNGYAYYTVTHSSPTFDEQALLERLKGDN
jgi:hypothetical protein